MPSSAQAPTVWWEKATPQEMLAEVHSPILNAALPDQWWWDIAPSWDNGWLTSTGTDRMEELLVTNITCGQHAQILHETSSITLKNIIWKYSKIKIFQDGGAIPKAGAHKHKTMPRSISVFIKVVITKGSDYKPSVSFWLAKLQVLSAVNN